MPIADTIRNFREAVLNKGGPQIAGMYEVLLYQSELGEPLACYPMSVVFPGRMFTFYDHDIWGPTRKIPYKRGYTQCHMTFLVYQDWAERTYIENWMNITVANRGMGLQDYVNYSLGTGTIQITCLNTDKVTYNREVFLKEAYPAAISQMTLSSDGNGYPSFTVTFQFNEYIYQ